MADVRSRSSRPSRRLTRLSLLGVVAVLASILGAAPVAADPGVPVTAGYRDLQYGDPAAPGADDVTAARNQSKLWFNDGRWFGILFDPRSTSNAKFRIYRFDMVTQGWTNTSIPVDDRNRSHADALAVGDTLYVASTGGPTSAAKDLRVYKYTYNATTKAYVAVAGFPKLVPDTALGTGYPVITADSTGQLWIAYPQSNKIMVASSDNAGATWTAQVLPGLGNDVIAEDVAAIAPISGSGVSGVGVMWDNQAATDDAFYYQVHLDSADDVTWQPRETVFDGPTAFDADNHISLKTGPSGNAIAAVKTGRDGDPAPNGTDPLIMVVDRTGAPNATGTWSSHPVTNVTTGSTRPILVIDSQFSQADVFLTDPTLASSGAQAIYRRTASLATLDFGSSSVGSAVIKGPEELSINDATSSKQSANSASGILVAASDIPTLRYLHACIGDPCPAIPGANFTVDTTAGPAPLTVQFTDSSTNNPTSWSWNFGDGSGGSALRNPSHTYASPGTYSVSLTAGNVAGADPVTKTDLITVAVPPATAFFPITPVRVFDSRSGSHVGPLTTLVANQPQTGQIGGRADLPTIPSDAIAVTGNLTVVGQTKAGFLSIGPSAGALGATSSLNFPLADIRANGVTVPLGDGTNGTLSIVYKAVSGSTNVVFDVTGYFRSTSATGATYHDVVPTRFLDSRSGNGISGTFKANNARTFNVTDRPDITSLDIPANATAVTGNLTVVGQTQAGFVSLGPDAGALGGASTLNFPLGDIRANNVTVKLGAGGTLSAVFKAKGGTTNLVFDITGYFTEDSSGARYVAVNPARVLDTRAGGTGLAGAFTSAVPRTWQVGGLVGIDPAAVSVIGNVTVVNQSKAGFVAVTPVATVAPPTSNLNFPLGDIRANGMTVKLGSGGTLSATYRVAKGTGTTNLVYDVFGYYK